MHIGDWLRRRSWLTPHKVALVDTLDGSREITYRQWNQSANQTANYLHQRLRIEKGDLVAVLAKNSVSYLDIWFALGKLGGILQNLNWRLAAPELTRMLQQAQPKALVYGGEFASLVKKIRSQGVEIPHWVALGEKAKNEDLHFADRQNFGMHPPPEVEIRWHDTWVICYTGGTTGVPKGAILTHLSITANAVNTVISWGLTAGDTTILNTPLFHTGGLNVFTAPLAYVGGTSIVCEDFDLEQTFDLLTSERVSIWFGVPTMFVMMQNHPRWEEADFSHLKLLISGGAPCPQPVFEKFWAKGVDFKTGYGLTEAGPNTFWLPPDDVQRKPGAVGFPLIHVDTKIVDEDGRECKAKEVGELVIRGPHLCAGYWNDPQATAAAIHPLPDNPHGPDWLFTGDLAERDGEGYYYIVGRSKDMFISGGENVYPAEIESVLHSHPAVAEAAVIAVPHQLWGEVGWAFVVRKPESMLTGEELLAFTRTQLADYKIPKSVVFLEELPKTGANKIDKRALRQQHSEIE